MAPFRKILSSRRSWLLVSLLGRPGENRTRRESAPRRRHSFRQRITELAAQWRRRAISFKENSSSNSFSARLRRSESNSAEPFGRIWTSCLSRSIIALFYVRSINRHQRHQTKRREQWPNSGSFFRTTTCFIVGAHLRRMGAWARCAERASSLALTQPQSLNTDGLRTSCAGPFIASVWTVRGVLGPTLQPLCHRARCRAAGRLAHAPRLPSRQLL